MILLKRIIVAVIGIPVILAVLFWGPLPFAVIIALITGAALLEFYRLLVLKGLKTQQLPGIVGGLALPLIVLYYGAAGAAVWLSLVFLVVTAIKIGQKLTINDTAATLMGLIYPALLLSYWVLLNKNRHGLVLVAMALVATWITDTAAYGIGRWLGRRPLAPKISPNKTIEGTVGAVLLNVLVFAFLPWMPKAGLGGRLVFAAVISIAAVGGDLVESSFKREAGVKDSGTLIPGHGGVLDRVDSAVFTGMAAYFLSKLLVL